MKLVAMIIKPDNPKPNAICLINCPAGTTPPVDAKANGPSRAAIYNTIRRTARCRRADVCSGAVPAVVIEAAAANVVICPILKQ